MYLGNMRAHAPTTNAAAQTSSEQVTDYEMKLRRAQKGEKILPVVWDKGRVVSTPPLSPLHLRIGLDAEKTAGQPTVDLTKAAYAPQLA